MNQSEKILELLDRYWEGESTLEEERQLKSYFNAGSVDPVLQRYAPLFKALKEEQAVFYAQEAPRSAPVSGMRLLTRRYMSIAAAVALALVSAAIYFADSDKPAEWAQTPATEVPTPESPAGIDLEPKEIKDAPADKSIVKTVKQPRKKAAPPAARTALTAAETEEAEKAWEEVKAALALVSSKINKGKREAIRGAEHLDLDKHLKLKREG